MARIVARGRRETAYNRIIASAQVMIARSLGGDRVVVRNDAFQGHWQIEAAAKTAASGRPAMPRVRFVRRRQS